MTSDALDQALTGHSGGWLGPPCGAWPDTHDANWAAELPEPASRREGELTGHGEQR
jgi:hypothetical protein